MMRFVSAFVVGTLFGLGLAVSGMMNPAKVLGFLDVLGAWDPTLAFVMAGGLAVTIPGFYLVRKRQGSLFGGAFQIPTRKDIDWKLVVGSLTFGVGWGIAGFCPGPAVAALSSGLPEVLLFMAALLSGMLLHKLLLERGG